MEAEQHAMQLLSLHTLEPTRYNKDPAQPKLKKTKIRKRNYANNPIYHHIKIYIYLAINIQRFSQKIVRQMKEIKDDTDKWKYILC